MPAAPVRALGPWLALVAVVIGAGLALGALGLPSPELFAALLVGLAAALAGGARAPQVPAPAFAAAQAIVGVALGTYLHADTLTSLGTDWIPVILVSLATLGVTTASGLVLGRLSAADPVTASLGTVAGGASGIVAMAGSLGGDDRLVAFMQYLRVLVVVLLTPVFVSLAFGAHGGSAPDDGVGLLTPASGILLVAVVAPVGAWFGERVRLPAATLLGPLILTAVLTLSGAIGDVEPPALLRDGAFAAIGLAIGLRFTTEQLRAAGRLLVPVLVSIVALIVACFGLGELLVVFTGVSPLDAYLATTPGGLYAVLPIAYGAGANTTFVLAVQALRLFVMILAAPLLTQWLLRRRG